jgi:hypothetical protein
MKFDSSILDEAKMKTRKEEGEDDDYCDDDEYLNSRHEVLSHQAALVVRGVLMTLGKTETLMIPWESKEEDEVDETLWEGMVSFLNRRKSSNSRGHSDYYGYDDRYYYCYASENSWKSAAGYWIPALVALS